MNIDGRLERLQARVKRQEQQIKELKDIIEILRPKSVRDEIKALEQAAKANAKITFTLEHKSDLEQQLKELKELLPKAFNAGYEFHIGGDIDYAKWEKQALKK